MSDVSMTEEPLHSCAEYREVFETAVPCTPFHDPRWLSVIEDVSRVDVKILRVVEGDEIIAIFPHVHGRRGILRLLLSPPSGMGIQYLGPLLPGWDVLKQDKRERRLGRFVEALGRHLAKSRDRVCQLRLAPGLDDARPFQWSGFETMPRYTYAVPLDADDALWMRLKKSVRSDIRRSESSIEVVRGNSQDLETLEGGLVDRFKDQGLDAPLPRGYLRRLTEVMGDRLTLLSARAEGKWVGGVVLVRFRDRTALWQGTTKGPPGLAINDLLIWESMRTAYAEGAKTFELMGANTERLARFKSKFNPHLESYIEALRAPWPAVMARKLLRGGIRH
jgi:hypothetical protein